MKEKHFDQEFDELLERIYLLKQKAISNLKTIPTLDDNKKVIQKKIDEQSTI